MPPVTELLGGVVRRLDLQAGILEVDYLGLGGFTNPAGHIQGGMLTAMLDDAMATLAQVPLAPGEFAPTLSLSVSFLRPALPGVLHARAEFVRRGREILNIDGKLYQDGRLVARACALSQVKGES